MWMYVRMHTHLPYGWHFEGYLAGSIVRFISPDQFSHVSACRDVCKDVCMYVIKYFCIAFAVGLRFRLRLLHVHAYLHTYIYYIYTHACMAR